MSHTEENHTHQHRTQRAPLSTRAPAPGSSYWLITRYQMGGRLEVLTLHCKKTLPVFSHKEEAQMFLGFTSTRDVGEGWRVTESGSGQLVSVLYGLCREVEEVALDPLPQMVAERTLGLVSLDRGYFIERLTSPTRIRRRRALRHSSYPEEETGRGSLPQQSEQESRRRSEVVVEEGMARAHSVQDAPHR